MPIPMSHKAAIALDRALQRLARWRQVFASWQLGTRRDSDPECRAVRDASESRLIMRAEMSALVALLIEKGVFTADEWANQLAVEARELERMLERRFPGYSATDSGMALKFPEAAETMKQFPP